MEDRNRNRRPLVGELPQWNSRFRFSAQRTQPSSHQEAAKKTPGALGQPRRVPVAADAAAAGQHAQPRAGGNVANASCKPAQGDSTPPEAHKTPTICLFEKFESLSLGTTPATATAPASTDNICSRAASDSTCPVLPGAAPSVAARSRAGGTGTGAGASSSTAAVTSHTSGDSEQWAVGRSRPARRSVAFGTPSVLTYTPAAAGAGPGAGLVEDGGTPLWSNAGHTPYSLGGTGSNAACGSCIQEVFVEEEDAGADSSTSSTAAAAGEASMRYGVTTSRHSGVRMELFTSVIHEVPAADAERTPIAALSGLKTPVGPGAADAALRQYCTTAATPGSSEGCGEGETPAGSYSYDDTEDDMELQTPATIQLASSKRAGAAAAAAVPACVAAPADSFSSGSSFTGFGGGGGTQQASSTTPTFFNSTKKPVASRTPGGGGSSLSALLAQLDNEATAAAAAEANSNAASSSSCYSNSAAGQPPAGLTVAASSSSKAVRVVQGGGDEVAAIAGHGGNSSSRGNGGISSLDLASLCFAGAGATPKSKLKQPERVAAGAAAATHVPQELKQLLCDTDAAAVVAGQTPAAPLLGSCEILSPVRPKKQVQRTLGAGEQVLTPVRRSARKATAKDKAPPETSVEPMLEATNYCYQPNEALRKA